MWALDGSYFPKRSRDPALVVVAGQSNPCTVFAIEGRVTAHIGDTGNDEPTARNRVASICQYVIDAMSVADLWPYTFVIEGWRRASENRAQIAVLTQDQTEGYFYNPVFETISGDFSVFEGGVYRFPDLLYDEDNAELLQDVHFRKATFFLSSAIRYPDHTSAFCIQAVEAIRAAFSDGTKTGREKAWSKMHDALGSETFSRTVSADEYQSEKHGRVVGRSWSERASVLGPAIEVVYRYARYWRQCQKDNVAGVSGG